MQVMINILHIILLSCNVLAIIIYALALWSIQHHLVRQPDNQQSIVFPPISLLKPIRGNEDALEANLRTFFEQDYPANFEIIFASTALGDPGVSVAKRLSKAYPNIPAQFVLSPSDYGLNPKVSNLSGALAVAHYDLVLQTDANVRIPRDYLQRIVKEFILERASILGCLVIGVGEKSVGAALDNLHLTTFISPAVCLALIFGNTSCIIGKSILFLKSELEIFGGLGRFKDVLAEDILMGFNYQADGKRVLISKAALVERVAVNASISSFFRRYARWFKITAVLHKPAFLVEFLANPIAFALLLAITSNFNGKWLISLGCIIILKAICDSCLVYSLRGSRMRGWYLLIYPLKDLIVWVMWVYAAFSRSIYWRGTHLRLKKGTQLESPSPPKR